MSFCPKCGDEFQDWVKVCPDCGVELKEELLDPPPEPKYSAEPIITIATYSYPTEAHLNRAKLESEGIDAFVADEHMIQANWLYSQAIGGIRLQVKESDAEKALSILKDVSEPVHEEITDSTESIDEYCPKCHSTNIQYRIFSPKPVFILWLISFFL